MGGISTGPGAGKLDAQAVKIVGASMVSEACVPLSSTSRRGP